MKCTGLFRFIYFKGKIFSAFTTGEIISTTGVVTGEISLPSSDIFLPGLESDQAMRRAGAV